MTWYYLLVNFEKIKLLSRKEKGERVLEYINQRILQKLMTDSGFTAQFLY